MENDLKLTIDGKVRQVPRGTDYLTLAKEYQAAFPYDIMLAKHNGNIMELNKKIETDGVISFVTVQSDIGSKTYLRGMIFLLVKALHTVFEKDKQVKVRIQHSIGSGYYGEVQSNLALTEEKIQKIKEEMKRLVEQDIPFHKRAIKTRMAEEMFHRHKMYDKEQLFRYRRGSKVNVYSLGDFQDYYYGYMPPSTGYLKYFDLFLYEGGFILLVPRKQEPDKLPVFKPREKLFHTLQEANLWSTQMGIGTVGALNEHITRGEMNDIILVQEAFQEKRLAEIAEQIKAAQNVKFVMIAGPSSSGKTTFSHRLSIQLRTYGLIPHPIAVDDYFVNREMTPRDENGDYNFECLEAIDVEQFNRDMTDLLAGKTVELPSFNFKTGQREYRGRYKTLGKNDILVIEGIHGLNDKLSYALPRENKFKIYISALTQLNIDEHNRIPTTDGRLLRRIVRDAKTRGTSAEATIKMWPSVRRGEEENIFPYQEDCDVMFNSALIYELAIIKQYAEPLLFSVPRDSEQYEEAKRLLKFLDYFLGVSSEDIPKNSILREFIGGSCF